MNEESTLRVLQALASHPEYSQRELAASTGFSLGKLNFILRALREKGWVKLENFSQNPNKLQYAYLLTPLGMMEKMQLTVFFLRRKEAEYEALQLEIAALQREVEQSLVIEDVESRP